MYRTTLRFIGLTLPFYQLVKYVDETPNETLLTATKNTQEPKCCIGKTDLRYLLKTVCQTFLCQILTNIY